MYRIALIKDISPTKQEHIRFGFKGKNQSPLFMVWKEYISNGRVQYADVLFSIG